MVPFGRPGVYAEAAVRHRDAGSGPAMWRTPTCDHGQRNRLTQ